MTPYRNLVAAAAVAWAAFGQVAAQSGAAGKVLILANGQVIEGQIDRVGQRYRVIKDGGETWLPADGVTAVCADVAAAYRTLSGKIGPTDANARIRLATWCESVGLRDQAIVEAKAALAIQPRHTLALGYLKFLESAAVLAAKPSPVAETPPATVTGLPPVEVGPDALKRFTTKVQPVLMNTCADCHARPTAVAFKLRRVHGGSGHLAATQANLTAAAELVDRDAPASSRLLAMAVTPHGGAITPPLRDKSTVPFKLLDEWATLIAAERRLKPGNKPSPNDSEMTTKTGDSNPSRLIEPILSTDLPKEAVDPFDPSVFNRRYHPGQPASPPAAAPKP